MKILQLATLAVVAMTISSCSQPSATPPQQPQQPQQHKAEKSNQQQTSADASSTNVMPPQYLGRWSQECENEYADSTLVIESNNLIFYGSEGPVRAVVQRGEQEIAVISELSGEGDTRLDVSKFKLTNGNKTLVDVTHDSQEPFSRDKCEAKPETQAHATPIPPTTTK